MLASSDMTVACPPPPSLREQLLSGRLRFLEKPIPGSSLQTQWRCVKDLLIQGYESVLCESILPVENKERFVHVTAQAVIFHSDYFTMTRNSQEIRLA